MKSVALINDISGLGRCSLAAAVPVLSVMGLHVCPIPTAVLTNQTCYSTSHAMETGELLPAYLEDWKGRAPAFAGICSGYLSSLRQAEFLETFIEGFAGEDTLVLIDPVMGDEGVLYPAVTEELCQKVRHLVRHARVITPNLTEACILTETAYPSEGDLLAFARERAKECLSLGPEVVILTGVQWEGQLHNFIVTADLCEEVCVPAVGGNYSGTGDLMAAAVMGRLLLGFNPKDAVQTAAEFLLAAIRDTAAYNLDPNDGVCFEPHLKLLMEGLL